MDERKRKAVTPIEVHRVLLEYGTLQDVLEKGDYHGKIKSVVYSLDKRGYFDLGQNGYDVCNKRYAKTMVGRCNCHYLGRNC